MFTIPVVLSTRPAFDLNILRNMAKISAAAHESPFHAPSLPEHLKIVALETFFTPIPQLYLPNGHTFTLTQYARSSTDDVPARIQDAHILITTTIPVGAGVLSVEVSPNLRLIAVMASGTDSIDLAACAARGIRVLNSPNCNTDTVAEHAVALYFAVRRSLYPSMTSLRVGEWPRHGTLMKRAYAAGQPPRACHQETVAIVGYGGVGQRVGKLLAGLGMKILVAARKCAVPSDGRMPFNEALKIATVVVLCCPRSPETLGLIGTSELALMQSDALLINVSRGGIVDETALVEALRRGQIAGAGVDVFEEEPASADTSPLLRKEADDLNLVLTPHTAWVSKDTTTNLQRVLQENIEGFILGNIEERRAKA